MSCSILILHRRSTDGESQITTHEFYDRFALFYFEIHMIKQHYGMKTFAYDTVKCTLNLDSIYGGRRRELKTVVTTYKVIFVKIKRTNRIELFRSRRIRRLAWLFEVNREQPVVEYQENIDLYVDRLYCELCKHFQYVGPEIPMVWGWSLYTPDVWDRSWNSSARFAVTTWFHSSEFNRKNKIVNNLLGMSRDGSGKRGTTKN